MLRGSAPIVLLQHGGLDDQHRHRRYHYWPRQDGQHRHQRRGWFDHEHHAWLGYLRRYEPRHGQRPDDGW